MDIHTATLIKSYIDAQPAKEYKSWRASSLGGCLRSHYFQRLGVEQTTPPDDTTMRKFLAGDIFHDFIGNIVKEEVEKLGGTVSIEQELYDKELDLGGRYDQLIELGDHRQLRDVKTQHSGLFHKLRREQIAVLGKPLDDATVEERQRAMQEAVWHKQPQWVKQIAGYMVLLKRAGTPVDEAVVIRVSKDDLSLAEVHYTLTDELEKIVLEELSLLNKHWKDKTLPPCTCGALYNGKGTHYCNYGVPESEEWVLLDGYKSKQKIRTKCCGEELLDTIKEKK